MDQIREALEWHYANAINSGVPEEVVREAVIVADICPHCKKEINRPGTVSSNYNEAAGLFFVYVLCDRCTHDMQRTSQKWKNRMTDKIERNLIDLHNNAT